DRRAEVLEARIRRIGRRIDRARTEVTEAAGHADAIRAHQVLAVVVGRVRVVALGIPFLRGLLVEVRIREQAQAEDAGRIAVVGADRDRLAARADRHTRILALVFERIGLAAGFANVEPESE